MSTKEDYLNNVLAMGEDVFPQVSIFVMQHNPEWMGEYQDFLDHVSNEFIPFISANEGAGKDEYFFKDIEREVEGQQLKGFVYSVLLTMQRDAAREVVKSYELFFPVDETGKVFDMMMLARQSELPRH